MEFVNSNRKPWESPLRHVGPRSAADAVMILEKWKWYWIYDFIEYLYAALEAKAEADWQKAHENSLREVYADETDGPDNRAPLFEQHPNQYFDHAGIGWRLIVGRIESRGSEAFERPVQTAREELDDSGRLTASKEIHEALLALSRRPDPDCTGSINHGMGALECVARDVTGDPKATLGEIMKRHTGLVPAPLDSVVSQAWGYASETTRHIREGRTPSREEAELLVGLTASVATYLSRKHGKTTGTGEG